MDYILDNYSDTVYKVALSQTKSPHHADDVFQEVFLRLVHKKPVFESETHLKAWLIRVTINCSNNIFRSAYFKRKVQLKDHHVYHRDEIENKELYLAVMDMPKKYAIVIHLHYYEGYSVKEMAELLNKKDATIKTHLYRGRQLLRETLEGGMASE